MSDSYHDASAVRHSLPRLTLESALNDPLVPLTALQAMRTALHVDPTICVGGFCKTARSSARTVGCLLTAAALTTEAFADMTALAIKTGDFTDVNSTIDSDLSTVWRAFGIKPDEHGDIVDSMVGRALVRVYEAFDVMLLDTKGLTKTAKVRTCDDLPKQPVEVISAKGRRLLVNLVDAAIDARMKSLTPQLSV